MVLEALAFVVGLPIAGVAAVKGSVKLRDKLSRSTVWNAKIEIENNDNKKESCIKKWHKSPNYRHSVYPYDNLHSLHHGVD